MGGYFNIILDFIFTTPANELLYFYVSPSPSDTYSSEQVHFGTINEQVMEHLLHFNHHDFHNCHQAFTIFWKETSINVVVVVWVYASSIGIPYGGELKRSFLQSQERWSILQRCRNLERVITECAERDHYRALLYCKSWTKQFAHGCILQDCKYFLHLPIVQTDEKPNCIVIVSMLENFHHSLLRWTVT